MPVAKAFEPWYASRQDPSRGDICHPRQTSWRPADM